MEYISHEDPGLLLLRDICFVILAEVVAAFNRKVITENAEALRVFKQNGILYCDEKWGRIRRRQA